MKNLIREHNRLGIDFPVRSNDAAKLVIPHVGEVLRTDSRLRIVTDHKVENGTLFVEFDNNEVVPSIIVANMIASNGYVKPDSGSFVHLTKSRKAVERAIQDQEENEGEWPRRMAAIESVFDKDVIAKAASIAWWDMCGSRPTTQRWSDLDSYLADWNSESEPDDDKVTACLVAMGYTPKMAAKRTTIGGTA